MEYKDEEKQSRKVDKRTTRKTKIGRETDEFTERETSTLRPRIRLAGR